MAEPRTPPRGRRPGAPATRESILAAAREAFAGKGFAGASVRAIARAAEVDPALVHHYFGTKEDLFVAALSLPVDPREITVQAVGHSVDGAGERLLRAFVGVWENPDYQPALVAAARGMLESEASVHTFTQGFFPAFALPIAEALGLGDEGPRRMGLVLSQLIGLIQLRYVFRLDPVVAMAADELVAAYAPTLQRYLAGPLD